MEKDNTVATESSLSSDEIDLRIRIVREVSQQREGESSISPDHLDDLFQETLSTVNIDAIRGRFQSTISVSS